MEVKPSRLETLYAGGKEMPYGGVGTAAPAIKLVHEGEEYWYYRTVFSSRRRHTMCSRDWSSDVCSSDLTRSPPEDRRAWRSEALIDQWAQPDHDARARLGRRAPLPTRNESGPLDPQAEG